MAVTLEDYLKNNKSIQAAQKKLKNAENALSKVKNQSAGLGRSNASQSAVSAVANRVAEAQKAVDIARQEFETEKASGTAYYNRNVGKINVQSDERQSASDKDTLAQLIKTRADLANKGLPTGPTDERIQDYTDRVNKTGKYAPKVNTTTTGTGTTGTGAAGFTPRDYATEITTTGQAVAKMSGPERRALAQRLKDAGYKVTVTDVYNQGLIDAYSLAISENQVRSTNFGQEIGFESFLNSKAEETKALGAGAGGTGAADGPYAIIANPTQAAAYVNAAFKSSLGRDATAAEIRELGTALVEAQRANPIKTKLNKQGVAERTGGVDPQQFIFAEIQKLPEYKQRVTSENDTTVQSLAKTAKANGLNLNDNFDAEVVDSWVKRIRAGEDVDVFKNKIRQQAFRAMPQAVRDSLDQELDLNANFATYINSYAKTFGVPATQVDIMKIIPLATDEKGFLSVPAYEKKKRTLTEWQYTPEAKEEVSNIASRVLKDFGFQG